MLAKYFVRYGLTLYELLKFALNWLASILFARLISPPQLVAQYEIISIWLATFTFASIWACLQYFSASIKKENNTTLIKHCFSWLIIHGITSAMLLALVTYYKLNNHELSIILFLYTLFFVISSILEYYTFILKKYITFYISVVLLIIFIALFLYVFISTKSINSCFSILVLYYLIKFIILLYLIPKSALKLSLRDFKLSTKNLIYPFLKALFGGLGVYINLWIVEALCSPVEFIEYRNSARELPVSLIIANSFSTSATALLSKTKVQPHQLSHITLLLIKKKSKEVLHILFLSNILFLILSRPLFEFLFAQKFTNAWKIFDWYLLLVIPRALFPQTLVNALGLWKQSYLITILECLLHIILSFVLTYFLGTTGAAIATLIAFSFEKILLNWLLYKKNIAPTCFIPAIIFLLYTIIIVLLFSLKLIFYS